MRVPIRVQLGSLILLASLIGLAVISIAVWITTHNFVLKLRASRLAQTASLKAAQLASNLDVMQTSASFVSSRVLIQQALMRYNDDGNNTADNWEDAVSDLEAAIGGQSSQGQSLLLQARVYSKNGTGTDGAYGLMNATAQSVMRSIPLPFAYPNGAPVYLGAKDTVFGFPPELYPNLTYSTALDNGISVPRASYGNVVLQGAGSTLLLGPWTVNSTFSMVSLTMPVVNNMDLSDLLGWLTVVMNAKLISTIMDSREGLDDTGETLILGPASRSNVFSSSVMDNTDQDENLQVRYIFPLNSTDRSRHPGHVNDTSNAPFNSTAYPVINKALEAAAKHASDNSGANLRATNEAKLPVSVGYSLATTSIVDWVVIVELSRKEVWKPINQLRDVILACVFATAGLMAVIAYPLAHFASLPILRLRQATLRSIEPPGSNSRSSFGSMMLPTNDGPDDDDPTTMARKEGMTFANPIARWKQKRQESYNARREEKRRRAFRIPAKVKERKYWVRDELSELTSTFNEMSDELMMQYSKLEDRVQQRTGELEQSKKAAEAANESKTLFIANISHELKTPLNGILGMCAVCMQEEDPIRLKRSLGIIYKSGDLLLNLLTDLLTFSKNQVGQTLSLDEKEFRLRDISSQTLAIFDKQAKEGHINLRVRFDGINQLGNENSSPERNEQGPAGTGRMRDMVLWGDVHRILQVVINLVSNALKFTPAGGTVVLTIRSLPDIPDVASRKSSLNSRQSRQRSSRHRGSDTQSTISKINTANAINAKDKPHALAYISAQERNPSPPPGRYVYFEFEVTDTGPGIPDPLLDKIFEPFVQGDLGLSKKFGGTGLGLSICSQLAQLMRGSMRVRSTVGSGSTFTMKIPLRHLQTRADSSASSAADRMESVSRTSSIDDIEGLLSHGPVDYDEGSSAPADMHPPRQAVNGTMGNDSQPRLVGLSQPFFATSQPMESPGSQGAAMQQIASQATRGGRIRVLVAEDNKVNQEVVLRMLKLEDIYDVTVAKDGQEALDLVKESMRGEDAQPFNLIFMDVQMPNVDGLQSTRLIREIGYQAPIVALTAFAEESNVKDCLDSGMNYFLSKPIRRPQLKKVLKEYCAPIPEEENEDVTPPEERRGSGVNTTIILNGQPAGAAPQLSTTSFENSAASSRPASTNDPARPVSPRDVT